MLVKLSLWAVSSVLVVWAGGAAAAPPFACDGFAQLGGAQLVCSHTDPKAAAQNCTFSWTLLTLAGQPSVAEGAFLLLPGTVNTSVYQGAGISAGLSPPIVLCQAKRSR